VPHRIIWSWYTGRWWVHWGGDWAGGARPVPFSLCKM